MLFHVKVLLFFLLTNPSPTSNQGEPLFNGHLLWSWGCPLNRGFIVFVLYIASSLFFCFQSSLNNFLCFALWACQLSGSILLWMSLITKTFLCSISCTLYKLKFTPNIIAWNLKWCNNGRYCQVKFTLRYEVILQIMSFLSCIKIVIILI